MQITYRTDPIRDYLRENNFLSYRLDIVGTSERLMDEYREVTSPSNKRNLHLKTLWKDIHDFGKPRKIVTMDLGGTNMNLFEIEVTGPREMKVLRTANTEFYQDKVYTPDILFSDLRRQIDLFLLSSEERTGLENFVFIFSYRLEQLVREDGYVDAICTYFGKRRKSEGIVGLQVGKAFQEHLRKHGYPNVNVSVTNDTTVDCLSAKTNEILKGEKYDAGMNIIVGTGANMSACYDESDVGELKGLRVINTEIKDFKGVRRSRFDELFDKTTDSPGEDQLEKMVSGAWQHQLFKVIVDDMIRHKIIGADVLEDMNLAEMDGYEVEKKLRERTLKHENNEILSYIWVEINKRGAAICGMLISGIMNELLKKLKKDHIRILMNETGSVIQKGMGFRNNLLDTIDSELGRLGVSSAISYEFFNSTHQAAMGAVIFDTCFSQ